MRQVTIYTLKSCPYCVAAKQLLDQRGVPYQEVILSEDDDQEWEALFQKSGMKTVPQIFAGSRLIGGYTELAKLDQAEGLKSLRVAS